MKTAIMTDTNSGITINEGKRQGIYVLPMPIIINGKDYLEEINLTNDILYKALNDNAEIVTSQSSPGDLMQMWDSILSDGYDELVYIPMSSGLSGSCSTAKALAKEYDNKVQIVDNHRISITLLDSVYDAKYMADMGLSARKIKTILEDNAFNNDIYITLHSLKRITQTGRITAAGAAIATVLNLKPILKIQGEKLDAFKRARGMQNAENMMFEAIRHDLKWKYSDVPKSQISIGVAGTLEDKKAVKKWVNRVISEFPDYKVTYRPLSCSIAAHIGTNTQGVAVGIVKRPLRL